MGGEKRREMLRPRMRLNPTIANLAWNPRKIVISLHSLFLKSNLKPNLDDELW